jgi:hypothetical protein
MSNLRRVRAGMAYLDRISPGWREDVDIDNLKMSSDSRCIIGQVYGSYDRFRVRQYMTWKKAYDLGFYEDDPFRRWIHYPKLTQAWKQELAA